MARPYEFRITRVLRTRAGRLSPLLDELAPSLVEALARLGYEAGEPQKRPGSSYATVRVPIYGEEGPSWLLLQVQRVGMIRRHVSGYARQYMAGDPRELADEIQEAVGEVGLTDIALPVVEVTVDRSWPLLMRATRLQLPDGTPYGVVFDRIAGRTAGGAQDWRVAILRSGCRWLHLLMAISVMVPARRPRILI